MLQINQITDDPLQQQALTLPDGTIVYLTLYYLPRQLGWFITSLTYGTFQLNGLRIINSPNMLHQFRNQIPFGLACFTSGNREPTQIEDFNQQNSILYILTSTEVNQYVEYLNGITI